MRASGARWLETRIHDSLVVYGFTVLGLFLLVSPWTPVWDQAVSGLLPERAWNLAASGWVRGAVSGLGALDLVVAFRAGRALRADG